MNKITIVTVTKNNLKGLINTYSSLISNSISFDWIIKDGGSTDGTLEYLTNIQYTHTILKGKDSGIFDAMNLALNSVVTEYVIFLNAGDRLVNKIELKECLKVLIETKKKWLVAGAITSRDSKLQDYWTTPTFPYYLRWLGIQSWCHQATLYRTDFLKKHGAFDALNIIADWSTALILESVEKPEVRVQPLAIFELGGISGSLSRESWIRLHTDGRNRAGVLYRNSKILDRYCVSFPAYYATRRNALRIIVPRVLKILRVHP
jgi:putative colanic acid biosynthesis glycosyltransferase